VKIILKIINSDIQTKKETKIVAEEMNYNTPTKEADVRGRVSCLIPGSY
jgi:hypothetical protein